MLVKRPEKNTHMAVRTGKMFAQTKTIPVRVCVRDT